MAQFDVFVNPVLPARRIYPYVVVLQSELADTGSDRIVAPLVLRARFAGSTGRLTPYVRVGDVDHLLIVPKMIGIASGELRELRGQLVAHRDAIVAAIDYLFLGV